jgi:6-pyruvoyltetrahydropterin/6-carboxytetrahydropterin synthase
MHRLKIIDSFSAGHQLKGYKGKCESLHGHNFRVEAMVAGGKLDKIGLLIDFKILKKILGEVLEKLDHKHLNQLPPFSKKNPSAENIAEYVFKELAKKLPDKVKLCEVWVWESDQAGACYSKR